MMAKKASWKKEGAKRKYELVSVRRTRIGTDSDNDRQ